MHVEVADFGGARMGRVGGVQGWSVLFCSGGVQLAPPFTPGVFHKECVITAFVGFSSCNGSSGRPC